MPRSPSSTTLCSSSFELRARLGFDGKLLGSVSRLFVDSVLGWYRRRLRASPRELVQSGAVVVVQRASSDLKRESASARPLLGRRVRRGSPELRRRPVELALRGRPGVVINAPLSVAEHGFTLHAATRAGAQDHKGREASRSRASKLPEISAAVPDGGRGQTGASAVVQKHDVPLSSWSPSLASSSSGRGSLFSKRRC
ncbi:MAG TPA: hypothetical protein VI072_13840 [Polyangiaceae bacterium]